MSAPCEFADFIRHQGFEPPACIEPGRFVRFSTNDKRRDDAGYAKLFADCEGGIVGDFRTGNEWVWQGRRESTLSDAERIARREQIELAKREAQAQQEREHAKARERAAMIWKAATPASADHPYLSRKRVSAVATLREMDAGAAAAILGYAPKSGGDQLAGRLLVAPVKVGDALSTLELIDGDGRKSAIYGGAKAGGYWAAQALPDGDGDGLTVLIGEGVATVLSAREATGHPSIAALSAGNLPAVA